MLIRIRSKDGNFRFELQPTDDVSVLTAKILETASNADPASIQVSNQPRGGETLLKTLKGRNLQQLGLKHGDLVFVSYKSLDVDVPAAQTPVNGDAVTAPAAVTQPDQPKRVWETVKEDAVDEYWRARDGKIPRGRDARMCRHSANGMCDYCMPLEPYDAQYQTSHGIKHMSYHAYIHKLQPGAATATSPLPPLTPLSYTVKSPCPSGNHPPWPAGICTACQPSAITLQPQTYRMVDHVEFADHKMVNEFLQAWRGSGSQRFGWLIGHYEPYEEVPMGVKAVIEAIQEPPQESEVDGLSLHLPWEDEPRVRALAATCSKSLTIVGQIFTDLTPDPEDRSLSLYKRHPQSFFFSGLETIFAGALQQRHPTVSRSSSSGSYGSRFVTCVISGDKDKSIAVQAYQASEQACAMVEADMIEASVDPGQVRVKEEDQSIGRYVPDVFYRYKNQYGIEVKSSAKPCFPVEYLIVNLTHGFPKAENPMFRTLTFPIENRISLQMQSPDTLFSSLRQANALSVVDSRQGRASEHAEQRKILVRMLSDWHLLVFIDSMGILSPEDVQAITRAATADNLDDPQVLDDVVNRDGWRNLMAITAESAPAPSRSTATPAGGAFDDDIPADILNAIADDNGAGPSSGGGSGGGRARICPHCTFVNEHGGSDCEVCGLPLG
ncbi:polyubiquitin-tagged protein recognition complex, Npl4 component [Auriculariales sp. MPI-PUGE-AT-0066]|nr:polyubiquitin-tagged protein recognition complex, Npl4 component [Auriculariales sp. MPI-PUGE-AT-0066]